MGCTTEQKIGEQGLENRRSCATSSMMAFSFSSSGLIFFFWPSLGHCCCMSVPSSVMTLVRAHLTVRTKAWIQLCLQGYTYHVDHDLNLICFQPRQQWSGLIKWLTLSGLSSLQCARSNKSGKLVRTSSIRIGVFHILQRDCVRHSMKSLAWLLQVFPLPADLNGQNTCTPACCRPFHCL